MKALQEHSLETSGKPQGLSDPNGLPKEGKLSEISSRSLIQSLNQSKFRGTLNLVYRDKKKKLWFYEGEVFRIQTNLVPELIGQMMVDRNWLQAADLRAALEFQKESDQVKRLGEVVSEHYGIDEDEIDALADQQNLYSFIQSLTWEAGDFQIQALDLKTDQKPLVLYQEALDALYHLMSASTETSKKGSVLDSLELWQPELKSVEVSQTPLWLVLAGARKLGLSGIVSIRRQSKIYEIVLKYGVPLTLYEGSASQARQTIVVRQASAEHESFFINQLFKLFSFLSGQIHFRSITDHRQDTESKLQFRDDTAVTRSLSSDEIPVSLRDELKIERRHQFAFLYRLLPVLQNFLDRASRRIRRFISSLKSKYQSFFSA